MIDMKINFCHYNCFSRFIGVIIFIFYLSAVSCRQQHGENGLTAADTVKPDDNRFTPVTLTAEGALDEPMNFEVLKDGRVYINERKGDLKVFNPLDKSVNLVGTIAVNTKYTSKDGQVSE